MSFHKAPEPLNLYRLGPTKEKELFKRYRDSYSGVVIPAHIASYYSKFCTEFLGTLRKPYFIDPVTYVFAQDPTNLKRFVKLKDGKTKRDKFGNKVKGDLRRSYKKIVEEHYAGPIRKAWESKRPLRPSDLKGRGQPEEFVRSVIDFQLTAVSKLPQKYAKYAKYAEEGGAALTEENPPDVIAPPYFFAKNLSSPWHSMNIELAKKTHDLYSEHTIYPVIFTTIDCILNDGQKLLQAYEPVARDGVFLWVNDFNGFTNEVTLETVAKFVQKLRRYAGRVILMYGDAYSLVLSRFGLSGFSSGICYGEKKAFGQDVDMEGAIPARYYIRLLKKKYQIDTTLTRFDLKEKAPDLVCGCQICRRKPDISTLTDNESKEHFMLTRAEELADLRASDSDTDLIDQLERGFNGYHNHVHLGRVNHLNAWAKILRKRQV